MKRLRRFFELSSSERGLLLKAAFLLAAVRVGLWLLPFQSVRRLVASARRRPSDTQASTRPALERIAWAVEAAARYVPKCTCLVKALAAQVILDRAGYPTRLQIGVANQEKGFEAHAWLESEGKVVIGEAEPGRYSPLLTLEAEKP